MYIIYKVFYKVLLNRNIPYVEDFLDDCQFGFRKGRSTTEQLSTIGKLIKKKVRISGEYVVNIHTF